MPALIMSSRIVPIRVVVRMLLKDVFFHELKRLGLTSSAVESSITCWAMHQSYRRIRERRWEGLWMRHYSSTTGDISAIALLAHMHASSR